MSAVPVQKLRTFAIVFLSAYAVLNFAYFYVAPVGLEKYQDALALLAEVTVLMLMWLGSQHWKTAGKYAEKIWTFFFLGVLFFFTGDVVWFILEHLMGQEVEAPSICDVFYVTSYVFLLLALFYCIKSKKKRSMQVVLFDVVISLLALATIIVRYGYVPTVATEVNDWNRQWINTFYPLMDGIYLIGLLALIFVSNRTRGFLKETLLIAAAFFCLLLTDQAFLIMSLTGYGDEAWLEPFWPIGLFFIAIASLNVSTAEVERAEEEASANIWFYIQTVLPYFFAVVIIFSVSLTYIMEDPIVLGANVTVILIMLRHINILIENRKLIGRLKESNKTIQENEIALAGQNEELRHLHEQKALEASTDFLTRARNRRYVNEYLDNVGNAAVPTVALGVLLIDVDYFKPINDTYGHQVGDEVLCLVADAMRSVTRSADDIVGRIGGDEFVLVLPGAGAPALARVARQLLDAIATAPMPQPGMKVGLSVGGAAWQGRPADYSKDALIASADKALYQVKEAGRHSFRVAGLD